MIFRLPALGGKYSQIHKICFIKVARIECHVSGSQEQGGHARGEVCQMTEYRQTQAGRWRDVRRERREGSWRWCVQVGRIGGLCCVPPRSRGSVWSLLPKACSQKSMNLTRFGLAFDKHRALSELKHTPKCVYVCCLIYFHVFPIHRWSTRLRGERELTWGQS